MSTSTPARSRALPLLLGESPALVEATPRKALPGPRDKKDRPKPSGTVPSVPRRKDD